MCYSCEMERMSLHERDTVISTIGSRLGPKSTDSTLISAENFNKGGRGPPIDTEKEKKNFNLVCHMASSYIITRRRCISYFFLGPVDDQYVGSFEEMPTMYHVSSSGL